MKTSIIAAAAAVALGLTASVALAQEAGFGNDPNARRTQVPAPSVNNAGDPAAGNPELGPAAQEPTAPQKQEDLYDSGASGASTGEFGAAAPPAAAPAPAAPAPADPQMKKPDTSNPAP